MYLHLGKDIVVRQSSVVAVFDLDNASQSHLTRDYLRMAQLEGRVVSVGEELPKSFVVCADETGQTVYLSQLASSTLLKRTALFR